MTDLKTWRTKRDLTLDALAEMLETNIPNVSRIEQGGQWPGPLLMLRIEKVTKGEVTASDILKTNKKVIEAAD